jgi:hypothetical protein
MQNHTRRYKRMHASILRGSPELQLKQRPAKPIFVFALATGIIQRQTDEGKPVVFRIAAMPASEYSLSTCKRLQSKILAADLA